jgi:hypothetical protein
VEPRVRQSGALGDLTEVPWGTPDVDELTRRLGDRVGAADLDRAASEGRLRAVLVEAGLTAMAERQLAVRHAFRGSLDWRDPTVREVHEALATAFSEDWAAASVCRLARVDLTGVDTAKPAPELWTEILNLAARQGTLEKLLDTALSDAALSGQSEALELARDRPWRVDAPAMPSPAGSAVPPRGSPAEDLSSESSVSVALPRSARRAAQRQVSVLWAWAFTGVVGVLVIASVAWAAWAYRGFAAEPVSLGGSLALFGAEGRLVLTRAGVRVTEVRAASTFSFAPQPLDGDGDGRVDDDWTVHLALTSAPCPDRLLILDRDQPEDQRWTVPVARADGTAADCRVRLTGLGELKVGTVVELDAGVVQPRRFALVDRLDGADAEAVALGPWAGCEACWPSISACAEAASVLLLTSADRVDAIRTLADAGSCAAETEERLRRAVPPAPEQPEPVAEVRTEPAPEPTPRPAPRPSPRPKPSPKRRR